MSHFPRAGFRAVSSSLASFSIPSLSLAGLGRREAILGAGIAVLGSVGFWAVFFAAPFAGERALQTCLAAFVAAPLLGCVAMLFARAGQDGQDRQRIPADDAQG